MLSIAPTNAEAHVPHSTIQPGALARAPCARVCFCSEPSLWLQTVSTGFTGPKTIACSVMA